VHCDRSKPPAPSLHEPYMNNFPSAPATNMTVKTCGGR
jgi:hypothetical protein